MGRCRQSLCKSPLCHTRSNACAASRNAAEQYFLVSSASLITAVIRWTCSMVECCSLNPYCSSGINRRSSSKGFSCARKSFSNSLEIIGSRKIGRYDAGRSGDFSGLRTSMTSAFFHSLGMYCK